MNLLLSSPPRVTDLAQDDYHQNSSYPPESLTSVYPNARERETRSLLDDYKMLPAGLPDVVVLTLPRCVPRLRRSYPHAQVHGIQFPLAELGVVGLCILLGVGQGGGPLYLRQVERLARELASLGEPLTWDRLIIGVRSLRLHGQGRPLLLERLRLVRPWIDDTRSIRRFIKPGRLLVIDIRDEWMGWDQAMLIASLMTAVLAQHPDQRKTGVCHLVLAYDEAHKFFAHEDMAHQLISVVRERRHLGINLLFSSQDPMSIPGEVLALLDVVAMMRHDSEAWHRHLGKYIEVFKRVPAKLPAKLAGGWAVLWSRQWHVGDSHDGAPPALVPMQVRPRDSLHGGDTLRSDAAG